MSCFWHISTALILATCPALVAALNYTVLPLTTGDSSPCPSQCYCSWDSKHVQCNPNGQEFNSFIKQVPLWTASLVVLCAPQRGSSIPLSLRPDAFRHLLDAREISVHNCPIVELPDELFAYLPLLSSVILRNLPFATLPPRLFRDSPSLRTLWLTQTPHYSRQSGRPLANTIVSDLRLTGTGLDGAGLLDLIAPIAGRLHKLSFNNRASLAGPLRLPAGAFNNTSSLEELNLSNNQLTDFGFLEGVSASRLLLSYNPVGWPGELSFAGLRPNWRPQALELNHAGLQRFPLGVETAFPALQELLLANNVIKELPAEPLLALKRLTQLDVGSNQIRRLGSELKPAMLALLYRDRFKGHVYLADNPVHCNCELSWIFDSAVLHNSLPKNVLCASGGELGGKLLIWAQPHQLLCLPPSKPGIQVHIAVSKSKKPTFDMLNFQPVGNGADPLSDVQQHQLPAGSTAQLICSSDGDPAPTLRWLWQDDLLKQAGAPRFQSASSIGIQQRPTSRLVLLVHQSQMLNRRMRLTCSATAAGTDGSVNSTVTLVSEVAIPSSTVQPPQPPQPPRPGGHQQKDGENLANQSRPDKRGLLLWQLVLLTAWLLRQL